MSDNAILYSALTILGLPLLSYVLTFFFGKKLPRQGDFIGVGFMGIAELLAIRIFIAFWKIGDPAYRVEQALHLARPGRLPARRGHPGRRHDRGDADGGLHRQLPGAPVLGGLHARRPALRALLRLPGLLHLLDAGHRAGEQPVLPVRVLGAGGPGQLPADRLLLPQALGGQRQQEGLPDQPRRRLRLLAGHPDLLHRHRHPELLRAVRRTCTRAPSRAPC